MSSQLVPQNAIGGKIEQVNLLNEFVKATYDLPCYAAPFMYRKFLKIFEIVHPDIMYLKDAVLTHVLWTLECHYNTSRSESILHKKFSNELSEILPGATIVKYKRKREHIPDFMIDYKGEIMPVEIKLHEFTKSSLRQLSRYMREYKTKKGIAVAKECKVILPGNIRFIQLDCPIQEFDPSAVSNDILDKINPLMVALLGLSSPAVANKGKQISIDGIEEDGVHYHE